MSGGHWDYLSYKIEERAGAPLDDVWRLLAAIEHEIDWGICGDTCYECARIRTVNALEAYYDTQATSIDNAMRILRSGESECDRCKKWDAERKGKREPQPRASITVDVLHEGKRYKGVVTEVTE